MLRVSRPVDARQHRAGAWPTSIEPEPEPELIENIIPIGQRRTLLELNEDTCRWPIGDPGSPEFFFCGGKPVTGLPYCALSLARRLSAGERAPQTGGRSEAKLRQARERA